VWAADRLASALTRISARNGSPAPMIPVDAGPVAWPPTAAGSGSPPARRPPARRPAARCGWSASSRRRRSTRR
jgi:hypothetical protein